MAATRWISGEVIGLSGLETMEPGSTAAFVDDAAAVVLRAGFSILISGLVVVGSADVVTCSDGVAIDVVVVVDAAVLV